MQPRTAELPPDAAEVNGLETDTSDVGTNVSTDAILSLPLEVSGSVRDPLAFTKLTPGFNGATGNSAVNFTAHYTINGSQSGAASPVL